MHLRAQTVPLTRCETTVVTICLGTDTIATSVEEQAAVSIHTAGRDAKGVEEKITASTKGASDPM